MYRSVQATVRSSLGETEKLQVKVGLHQGSTLSPFLFNIVMEVMTDGVREGAPWCMMYADDVVLCAETKVELEQKLEAWRRALEERGIKISRKMTEFLKLGPHEDEEEELRLGGKRVNQVDHFRYLGSLVDEGADVERKINCLKQAGWKGWREMSGVLCDKKIPVKLKGKVYKTAVRLAMLYGMETLPVKKANETRMNVTEMRMLRWMCGVSREDRIRNENIRGSVKVTELSKKMQEVRLKWYGHMMRRENNYVGRKVMEMDVPGRQRRGRPKKRWKDYVVEDMRAKSLLEHYMQDRTRWRRLTMNSDPI